METAEEESDYEDPAVTSFYVHQGKVTYVHQGTKCTLPLYSKVLISSTEYYSTQYTVQLHSTLYNCTVHCTTVQSWQLQTIYTQSLVQGLQYIGYDQLQKPFVTGLLFSPHIL